VDLILVGPYVQVAAAVHNLIGVAMAMNGVESAAKEATGLAQVKRYLIQNSFCIVIFLIV
jgi:hypothetical protein